MIPTECICFQLLELQRKMVFSHPTELQSCHLSLSLDFHFSSEVAFLFVTNLVRIVLQVQPLTMETSHLCRLRYKFLMCN